MDNISLIPRNKWYKKKIGDPAPSYISIYNNKLYTNFGDEGVATFNLDNPKDPQFENIIKIKQKIQYIQPIHINNKGILFCGDYYSSNIYMTKIN